MTDSEFADWVEVLMLRGEQFGAEVKGPGKRDDTHLFAKVTRAALSMANRRDGGLVIIGLTDAGGVITPTGLTADELNSWQKDMVADGFAVYCDPPIDFDLYKPTFEGKQFVVLQVHEFQDRPIVCKKRYEVNTSKGRANALVLRDGAFYVRSRRKPETIEAASEDMRDLIELATEKRLRQYIRMLQAVQLLPQQTNAADSQQLFDKQIEDLL